MNWDAKRPNTPFGRLAGHHIPEVVIRRRYQAGLDNFPIYADIVDYWTLLDNDRNQPIELLSGGKLK